MANFDHNRFGAQEGVEFSRTVSIAEIRRGPLPVSIQATPEECADLAQRFDLISLSAFRVDAEIVGWRNGVRATGRITGQAIQRCVATLAPVPASINDVFDRGFLPDAESIADVKPGAEIEMPVDSELGDVPDPLGAWVDIGEIAAEALGLALDPYPRVENTEFLDKRAAPPDAAQIVGVETKPFASLAEYRERLAAKKHDN